MKKELPEISATCLTPILYVRDFQEAIDYYTKKLLFRVLWQWGDPPCFGCVRLGRVEIFLCLGGQGNPGSWLSLFMDELDDYYERVKKLGAEIIRPPQNEPWGCREFHLRDPNQHVIRFSQGIPAREPKLPIERVPVSARLEKRLAAVIQEIARHKDMTIGEMLEETLLHTFEPAPGGVASPHTQHTLSLIQRLKKKHGINYDTHASYRFVEKRRRKKKH
jgi:catechol 2,3-dioxygenase-like lactoylglutathione lyase family enzyme